MSRPEPVEFRFDIILTNGRISWHVDPVLGNAREIDEYTAAVGRQRPANSRGMVFFAQSGEQQLNSNREAMFSVWSAPRCYKQNNESVHSSSVK